MKYLILFTLCSLFISTPSKVSAQNGSFERAGRAIDAALKRSWANTKRRHQKLKKALSARIIQCGVYQLPLGEDTSQVKTFSEEFFALGTFKRKIKDVKMAYNNSDVVYVTVNRATFGASKISIKNYIQEEKGRDYKNNIKLFQYFKMKDLENGKKLIIPFMTNSVEEKWIGCNMPNVN
jgi:hypothetical protein